MPKRIVLLPLVLLALAGSGTAHAAPVFVVEGRGWGHGIGMSQYGAQGFARQGWSHQRILAHYYRGTQLGRAEARDVRVLLGAGRKQFVVSSARPFRVIDAAGRKAVLPARRLGLGPKLLVRIDGKSVRLRSPVRFEAGLAPLALDGNGYRGALVIRSRAGTMSAVNHVTLERYLRGVVPWEMPHHWHPEALKAQAVAARSYTLATLKPREIFDLYDDDRSQVYGGIRAEKPATNRAVDATAGRVVRHEGRIAVTFYHSTSGGRTALVRHVWPKAEPHAYLRPVADPHDRQSPHHTWGPVVVTRNELAEKLKAPALRRTTDLVVTRNGSDRADKVRVHTPAGVHELEPARLRSALRLRSTWFRVGVLDLRPPRQQAVFGRPVVLRGIARGVSAPVIQRRDGGTWRQVAVVRARPNGTFTTQVVPQPGAVYRIAATHAAGAHVRVPVAPQVRLSAAAGTVRGRVEPALPRTRVAIQRRTPAGWRTVAAASTDGSGAFASAAALPGGDYRALVEPGGPFVPGASPAVRLRSE